MAVCGGCVDKRDSCPEVRRSKNSGSCWITALLSNYDQLLRAQTEMGKNEMFHALCWATQSGGGACSPIQLLEMNVFLGLLFVGEASDRIQAHKSDTGICAILKAERKSDLTAFLGEAKLVSIFGSVPDSLAALFRSAALDALTCKLASIDLPSLLMVIRMVAGDIISLSQRHGVTDSKSYSYRIIES